MGSKFQAPATTIWLTGFMATGKSVVGRVVAATLDLEWVDTDEMIERGAGMRISQIFGQRGEEAFRDLETEALREALSVPGRVVSTGGGMLLREQNLAMMRETGPIVRLTASAEVILQRSGGDDTRPLLQRDDPMAAVRELLTAREPVYAQADYHIDTDAHTPEETADAVVGAISGDARARYFGPGQCTVPVRLPGESYDISVGRGLLGQVGELWPPVRAGVRCVLVSCESVAELYGHQALAALAAAGWEPTAITVRDGESSKALDVYGRVCDEMARGGMDRGGCVFALGGGVVGDLSGFAAATYMRGIDLVHVPTTLLAQVDSSIGGKTAVDLTTGKNLVGAFHQPRAVISDVATLATLPPAEMRSGLGEIVKHACCFDAELFEFISARRNEILAADPAVLEYMVARNCQIKAEVVQEDPHEKGLRAVLNYGHTIGHALERAAGEWDLRHGEVVAIGIVGEARVAQWLGLADEETVERQVAVLEACGLPTGAAGVDLDRALEALRLDKKIVAGRLRMPLVPEIGSFKIVEDASLAVVERGLQSVLLDA